MRKFLIMVVWGIFKHDLKKNQLAGNNKDIK